MTEAALTEPDLPSPAAALESRFATIQRESMHDVPMLNPALQVQALGFRPWDQHWLGVLITPWFMNLLLFPRQVAHWPTIGERESRHYVFPAGVFEFIGNRDAVLGDYQACSLFSPMEDFATQAGAIDTARAALEALFDPAHRLAADVPAPAEAGAATAAATPAAEAAAAPAKQALSKRDFLFGGSRRSQREP